MQYISSVATYLHLVWLSSSLHRYGSLI